MTAAIAAPANQPLSLALRACKSSMTLNHCVSCFINQLAAARFGLPPIDGQRREVWFACGNATLAILRVGVWWLFIAGWQGICR